MLNQIFFTVNGLMNSGLALAALGCFLWGIISVIFSPCHIASIPLIIAYVAGQNRTLEVKSAVKYASVFTIGLFMTIATAGIICSVLGRMLGDTGRYWLIAVGILLLVVAADILGLIKYSMPGNMMNRIRIKGLTGAFILGLSYGLLSGPCTFGFIAPILALITIQKKIISGILLIIIFGTGHCIPIAIAGSSTATVTRILENSRFQNSSIWFKKLAGSFIGLLGLYFISRPIICDI